MITRQDPGLVLVSVPAMSKVKGIKIEGLNELVKMLDGVDKELSASVIRNVSRKPANRVVSVARKLFPYKKTGATKRSFGVLKVQDKNQRYLEVGVKGRSLAWIFMKGADRKNRGKIKPLGNLLWTAADQAQDVTKELAVNINGVLKKYFSRKARRR